MEGLSQDTARETQAAREFDHIARFGARRIDDLKTWAARVPVHGWACRRLAPYDEIGARLALAPQFRHSMRYCQIGKHEISKFAWVCPGSRMSMLVPHHRRRNQCFAAVLFCVGFTSAAICAEPENWTRFRGPNGSGVSTQQGIPATWSPGDYAWNVELPGVGHAAPIVWDHFAFVTSAEDEGALRHLFCLDVRNGEILWTKTIGMNRSSKHNKSSWASSTATTNGKYVFVAFSDKKTYELAAYDFSGELAWRRNLGTFESRHGLGTSPIIFEDTVIITNDQRGPSSVIALDCETGQTRWVTRREAREVSYATPIVIRPEGEAPQLICASGAMGLTSFDPYTGRQIWTTGRLPLRTVASPVYGGGLVIASCGQGGRYGVLQIAVDPSGQGDVSETHIKWTRKKYLPYVPTPVVYKDHLYEWGDEGIVSCVDIKTGEDVWTKRIGGNYSGSPICIDGKLYGISEDGDVVVLAASPEYELLGKTALGDFSHSTPAVGDGKLLLRSYHRLVCLEAQNAE